VARTRSRTHTRIAPQRVIDELRVAMPWVVARIASAIQAEVPALAGPLRGERRRLIEEAVRAGIRELADRAAGKARPDAGADELFRRLGHAEAFDGATLDAMRAACGIAIRDVWGELHRIALAEGLPTWILGQLGDALFDQAAHLLDEIEAGHRSGVEEAAADVRQARVELARRLLVTGAVAPDDRLVERADWALPERVVVLAARADGVDPDSELGDALMLVEPTRVLALCDAQSQDDAIKLLSGVAETVAISLPVPIDEVPAAAHMVERALGLIESGVIPRADVVDCADHEVLLWLHAEPTLTDRLASRLLAPLEQMTPHRRRVLAQTLMLWLERRASATVIAERLGVHPQTVRHRMRALQALFGEQLHDPETAFALLLALKATVRLPDRR
jgi:hypothetical protein